MRTNPRRKRGRPPNKELEEQRRAQIVSSAVAVFAERGYADATIADIARHAGVGQGTIYRYVPSKRGLLDLVFDYSVEEVMNALRSALFSDDEPIIEPADVIARIDAAFTALADTFDRRPELLSLVLVEAAAVDEELKLRVIGIEASVARMLAGMCETAQEAGIVRRDIDPDLCGLLACKFLFPVGLREIMGQRDTATRERYSRALIDFLSHALAPDAEGMP